MRGWAIIAAMVAIAAPAAVEAQSPTAPVALPQSLGQCIHDNAAKVEAAMPDLNAGVDFLVNKLCAVPVASQTLHRMQDQQLRYKAQLDKACNDQKAKPAADAQGLPGMDVCAMKNFPIVSAAEDEEVDGYDGIPTYPGAAPPSAIALASNLLLDLRLSKSNSRQSQ